MLLTKTNHPQNKNLRAGLAYEIRWRGYLEFTHDRFISNLKLASDDHILDVSCGTGLLAKKLIDQGVNFNKMILNDISEEMQSLAHERFCDRPDVSFTNYPAEEMDFLDASFTSIFCLNAFHYYHNQHEAMSEFARLLRPGGRLYLLDWNRSGLFSMVNRIISWWVDDHIDTRSLEEIQEMAKTSGFKIMEAKSWKYRYWNLCFIRASKQNGN